MWRANVVSTFLSFVVNGDTMAEYYGCPTLRNDKDTAPCDGILLFSKRERRSTMPPTPPPWRNSDAKKQLERDILDGKTDNKFPKQVYKMRAEYKQYKFQNFSPNFTRLKNTLKALQDRADEDEAAFLHDEALNLRTNSKQYPRWGGTVAERLLKIDIKAGKHKTMKPRELQSTRLEYSPYPLKVFRDHIQQELRARLERSYWLAKKHVG